jgi:hypothetical protein
MRGVQRAARVVRLGLPRKITIVTPICRVDSTPLSRALHFSSGAGPQQ